jgi:hypothetical protein
MSLLVYTCTRDVGGRQILRQCIGTYAHRLEIIAPPLRTVPGFPPSSAGQLVEQRFLGNTQARDILSSAESRSESSSTRKTFTMSIASFLSEIESY